MDNGKTREKLRKNFKKNSEINRRKSEKFPKNSEKLFIRKIEFCGKVIVFFSKFPCNFHLKLTAHSPTKNQEAQQVSPKTQNNEK